jgi:hypothetical protein
VFIIIFILFIKNFKNTFIKINKLKQTKIISNKPKTLLSSSKDQNPQKILNDNLNLPIIYASLTKFPFSIIFQPLFFVHISFGVKSFENMRARRTNLRTLASHGAFLYKFHISISVMCFVLESQLVFPFAIYVVVFYSFVQKLTTWIK